ncbi:hypothetical protein [Anabaena azotica]|uniref:Transposase n=1 Tax=Anabaena azotica FACHB-119 TaxID=947527 RepID=A0ABR8DBP7_9NOST|nr:hypothetical protein [Anabaena azotica]MBD2504617.1 hypothetical protein [Anabaena azotica FACHB-119]
MLVVVLYYRTLISDEAVLVGLYVRSYFKSDRLRQAITPSQMLKLWFI